MKTAEIVVGEEYRVGTKNYAERARVIGIGVVTKRVYSGVRWDIRGHDTTQKRVHIEYLNQDGTVSTRGVINEGVPRTEWVLPAQVLQPWAPYAERQQAAAAVFEHGADIAKRLSELTGLIVRFHDGSVKLTATVAAAEALLAKLEELTETNEVEG